LPRALSLPATDARGRVLLAAGPGAPILQHTEAQAELSSTEFPALLVLDGARVDVLPRGNMTAHSGFPVAGMKLQQLVPDRANDGYVAYDESSGELLRLRIRGGDSAADAHR
jgi:hypothetical protein